MSKRFSEFTKTDSLRGGGGIQNPCSTGERLVKIQKLGKSLLFIFNLIVFFSKTVLSLDNTVGHL